MNTKDALPEPFLRLERRDLIRFEQRLRKSLAPFIPHTGCTLHFPNPPGAAAPEYLPDEERLLLPLYAPHENGGDAGSLLGVFVARGVPEGAYRAVSGSLPVITALAMENLQLYKAAVSDAFTGLFSRQHFLARMAEEVQGTSDSLRSEPSSREVSDPDAASGLGGASPCLAALVIRLHGLRQVVRKHGYTASEDILALLGRALRDICPEQGTTARVSDYELAVLMPAATAGACKRFAGTVLEELGKVSLPHELTRSRISVTTSIGYALYPQDITGNVFLKPAPEQARILLRKARLAAALAAERLLTGEEEPVLAFGRILSEGGRVAEMLPLSRVTVSLGSAVNAREGQRFSVRASGGGKTGAPGSEGRLYKGELVLIEVKENSSVAEILHEADPSNGIAAGDSLVLLPGEVWGASRAGSLAGRDGPGAPDPVTGLLRHGDFLAAWSEGREKCDVFSLALLRLLPPDMENGAAANLAGQPDQLMAEAARLFRDLFGQEISGGRYGLASFMVFHPGADPKTLQPKYEELCSLLASRFFPGREGAFAAAGLAGYPYLDFRKADVLENCRKALEYGILLPAPHVGVFDSLAMTISADKRFSHGDTLGAMTEYKQALLADDGNALAWNSLGVTLARLGRHNEARGHFGRAVALAPEANALYNMGYTCQCLGERDDAKAFYGRCLEKAPGHLYALVRLGQMAESEGDTAGAKTLYDRAGTVPGGMAVTRRCLAGLCLREGKAEEARELLHEALALDPQNAVALQMLAELYLDGGEDAEVAESLARQSIVLRPERKSGWLALSRALEKTGRSREAREALMRAGAL
ncbi:Diguanylate cyclase and serine/threonine protein kinase with TPR repeats [uncultured delta proteobacterium]|uniref:Diguanylate cyclase and serine/threonine protein kinase with TPR repeats n=1 Tax=uncultured delta proteobacterium TaxID=34034 RepID=A0A212K0Q1_9DELT|nr:Diguanylate cyclase and serine/threonine protein kinase with TPR repeats [uncultured delta proteobacterium]